MKAQVKKVLDKGIVRESNSPGLPQPYKYIRRAQMGNQNLGFVSIFELLILWLSSTLTLYWYFKTLVLPFMVPNILQLWTATLMELTEKDR